MDNIPPHSVKPLMKDHLLICLSIVAKIYHHPISLSAVTSGLPLENGKLTPTLFERAATRAYFSSKLENIALERLSALMLPAILLLNDEQACVLQKLDHHGNAFIIHPNKPNKIQTIRLDTLAKQFSGSVIFIRPEFEFSEQTHLFSFKKSGHWFWDMMKRMAPLYTEVLIASFLINLFLVASPLFTMNVYDRVVPNHATDTLWVLASGMFVVFAFDFILRTLRHYFIDTANKSVDINVSAHVFEQLLSIRMDERPHSTGTLSNIVQAFELFRDFITASSITVLIDLPFVFVFLMVIGIIGGPIIFVPLATIPIIFLLTWIIQKPLHEAFKTIHRLNAEKQVTLFESLNNIEQVKTLHAESTLQHRWERIICKGAMLSKKLQLLSHANFNASLFIQQLTTILVVIVGVYLIANGKLTTGALVACTILVGRVMAPMTQMAGLITRYQQSVQGFHAVEHLMAMKNERQVDRYPIQRELLKGKIEFRNVTFRYPKQTLPTLNDVSFVIHQGERVGIIGRIGSGKTTIEKLLMRLYQPENGGILFDDIACEQFDASELRQQMGYVPQEISLFSGTILNNMTFGIPHVNDHDVLRAAEISGVSLFVNQDPEGFNKQVGEKGERLSGGQRQTIAIARAIIQNPTILVMDEPTFAMDDKTESIIKHNLMQFCEGKTVVLVTHRGSMLSLVNRLIVLEAGQIIADGPKEQILKALAEKQIKTPTL